jgi:tRNA A22 N-methylase
MKMPISQNASENISNETEACYEIVASQEEVYLEESEEELRAILIFATPCVTKSADETLAQATEELITGDADDPPLSDEAVEEMVRVNEKLSERDDL